MIKLKFYDAALKFIVAIGWFEKIPVGRHEITCSCIGYEPKEIANLVVLSGPAGTAMTAYDGDISGAVIAGKCWLAP